MLTPGPSHQLRPTYFARSLSAAIALTLLLDAPTAARATEELPIIVTYEMQKLHSAERVERRDPKTFWIRQIVARLEDRKPDGQFGLKEPATVQLAFTVGRDGQVLSKTVRKTSGLPEVDKAALAMVDRAQPFPPMPAAMTDTDLAFSLPLRFR